MASLAARFGGQAIDFLVVVGFFSLGELLLKLSHIEALYYAGFVFGIIYYLLADALPGGQSIGKQVVGTAVIDVDSGQPCTLAQSFGRNFTGFFGPIDWIMIFFGGKAQRLGDRAADTIVVWKSSLKKTKGAKTRIS